MGWLGKVIDGAVYLTVKNPIVKGAINVSEDLATRGYYAVTGKMNYDITGKGRQISGMSELKRGDILLKQGAWNSGIVIGIGLGQSLLNRKNHRYAGAGLLGHAVLYMGGVQSLSL